MSLIGLLVALLIAAVIIWAVRTILPLLGVPANIAQVIWVIVVVIVLLWFLGQLVGYGPRLTIG